MQRGQRGEAYRIDQTGLVISPLITVLKRSDELDWPDLNVSLTHGKPCELVHSAHPDLWFLLVLNEVDVTIVTSGREQRQTILANQLAIIPPGTYWSARWWNDVCALNVFVRRRLVAEVANELFGHNIMSLDGLLNFGIGDHAIVRLLQSLADVLSDPGEYTSLGIDYISRALIACVLRKCTDFKLEELAARSALTVRQAQCLAAYIRENVSTKLSLKELAGLIGLSQAVLSRRFKLSFRRTPHQYVLEMRVSRARELLEKSDLPIAQIATSCGFADQAHLSISFKRNVGMTPSQYRRLAQ